MTCKTRPKIISAALAGHDHAPGLRAMCVSVTTLRDRPAEALGLIRDALPPQSSAIPAARTSGTGRESVAVKL
jgi:hypothetical protein